ncbi:MAG: hypothetical protein WCP45_18305 [Verrucomicrobiota bacterium]
MNLTPKQRRFAKNIAAGMGQSAAAAAAGYANDSRASLAVTACRMLKNPDIQRAAYAEREARLAGPLAHKALSAMEGVLDNPDAPAASKVQAARWILEAGGHGIESRRLLARIGEVDERAVSLLSVADLERLVTSGQERVRFVKASIIEAETVPPSADPADSAEES